MIRGAAAIAVLAMFSTLCGLMGTAWGQCPGLTSQVVSFAKESLTITSSVPKSLTAATYKPSGVTPALAMVSVEGGKIRYDVVGTPTPADGHPASGTFPICGYDNIKTFQAIAISSDATVHATYYKIK